MKQKTKRIVAGALLAVLGLAVVSDGLLLLGLSRGWQYLYNIFFFLLALPVLVYSVMKDEQ